jgi:hypothetical protein
MTIELATKKRKNIQLIVGKNNFIKADVESIDFPLPSSYFGLLQTYVRTCIFDTFTIFQFFYPKINLIGGLYQRAGIWSALCLFGCGSGIFHKMES